MNIAHTQFQTSMTKANIRFSGNNKGEPTPDDLLKQVIEGIHQMNTPEALAQLNGDTFEPAEGGEILQGAEKIHAALMALGNGNQEQGGEKLLELLFGSKAPKK